MEFKILGNKEFLKDMVVAINKICPNKTKSVRRKGSENVYILTYNFATAKSVLCKLYEDKHTYLYRKFNKYLELQDTVHEDIVYSEPQG